MKILAFDTSNNACSIAISSGQTILAYMEDLTPSIQAQMLLPMIGSALKETNLSYEDIDYLAVTNGPGSFTGIRIGLAAATGLLLGSSMKGGSVSNFEMSYYRAKSQVSTCDKIIVLLNAYREQLYLQVFNRDLAEPPLLLDYDQAVQLLTNQKEDIVITGSGVEFIYDRIRNLSNSIFLPRFTRVKAMHICRYVDDLIRLEKKLNPIEPLYIRPPDAKV